VTVVEEPLYRRDGSRFVLYSPARQHTPPIPVPVAVDDSEPSRERPVVEQRPGVYRVFAPRCPHGRFRGCNVRGCPGPG
jgi:hypothetical protein